MPDLVIRPARPEDAGRLRAWDEKPHIMEIMGENEGDEHKNWGRELARHQPWRWRFIAEVEGNPIGIVQIIDPAEEEPRYWGEVERNLRAIDIWIGEEEYIGRGFGTAMMAFALAHCFDKTDVTAVLIDPLASNMNARRFYEKMGFERVGPRRFGKDDCMVYRLGRERWRTMSPKPQTDIMT